MATLAVLESKLQAAARNYSFTFALAAGVTISSASCVMTVVSGTDASPNSMISGSATISGATVTQKITGGVEGVTYLLTCSAVLSDGETLKQAGNLAVVPSGS